MGTYYHLYNDTKKEEVHFDHCIKLGPITQNAQVQKALVFYMMANQGDRLRFMGDYGAEPQDYKEVDMKTYDFKDDLYGLADDLDN